MQKDPNVKAEAAEELTSGPENGSEGAAAAIPEGEKEGAGALVD